MQASRPHAVTEADYEVILVCEFKEIVILNVERVVFAVVYHPRNGESAASADDSHNSFALLQYFKGFQIDPRVDGHKINAVLGVLANRVEHVVCRH